MVGGTQAEAFDSENAGLESVFKIVLLAFLFFLITLGLSRNFKIRLYGAENHYEVVAGSQFLG